MSFENWTPEEIEIYEYRSKCLAKAKEALASGRSHYSAADAAGISGATLTRWAMAAASGDPRALLPKKSPGRPIKKPGAPSKPIQHTPPGWAHVVELAIINIQYALRLRYSQDPMTRSRIRAKVRKFVLDLPSDLKPRSLS